MGPGLSKASGLLLCSTITSNVLSSTACSATDNGVFEEEETLKQRERGCGLCDDSEWDDRKCQESWKKNRMYEMVYVSLA